MPTGYRGTLQGSVQDDYFDNFSEGFPGQIATRPDLALEAGYPAEADFGVGLGVVKGAAITETAGVYNNIVAPYAVTLPDGASVAADFVGIVIRNSSTKNDVNGNPIWEAKDLAPIMREGKIFVTANQNVAGDDPVWLIIADNGGHGFEIGSFANADLGNADTILIPNAKFWKAASAGDVAIIELIQRT